jgi:hypothetical protein
MRLTSVHLISILITDDAIKAKTIQAFRLCFHEMDDKF